MPRPLTVGLSPAAIRSIRVFSVGLQEKVDAGTSFGRDTSGYRSWQCVGMTTLISIPMPFLLMDTLGFSSSMRCTLLMLSRDLTVLLLPDLPLFRFRLVPSSWYFPMFRQVVEPWPEPRDQGSETRKPQQLTEGSQIFPILLPEILALSLIAWSNGKWYLTSN